MSQKFQIIAPDRRRHGEEILDLACKIFGGYFQSQAAFRSVFLTNNHYSFEHSRIGLMDGKLVTHFGVFDFQMRVGQALLRTAGIGYVATHGDYRNRGFMAQTARACLAALREQHFHLSLLFGLENFYEQFGYTRAWSETLYTATLDKLQPAGKSPRLKPFDYRRLNDFAALHRRYHDGLTGSAKRPTYHTWADHSRFSCVYWNDSSGKAAGYVMAQDAGNHVGVAEAVGDPDAILHACVSLAKKFACDEIRFGQISRLSPLARRLERGNVQLQIRHIRNGGAVARIIDFAGALAALAPELSRRIKHSPLADYRGDLRISSQGDSVDLHIDRGTVSIAEARGHARHSLTAGPELSQLLLGNDLPENVMEAHRFKLKGDARLLAPVLFPAQEPMIGTLDRF